MRKLTKKSLDELAILMPVIEETDQMVFVGGGSGTITNPYTLNEFDTMCSKGIWNGGYVDGMGYINYASPCVTITGQGGGHIINTSDLYSKKATIGLSDVISGALTFLPGPISTGIGAVSLYLTAGQSIYNDKLQNTIDYLTSNGINSVYMVRRTITTSSGTSGTSLTQYDYTFYDSRTGAYVKSFNSTY